LAGAVAISEDSVQHEEAGGYGDYGYPSFGHVSVLPNVRSHRRGSDGEKTCDASRASGWAARLAAPFGMTCGVQGDTDKQERDDDQ